MLDEALHFDVFGTRVTVLARDHGWIAYLVGDDGVHRAADFVVPDFIDSDDMGQYLADLLHEAASPTSGGVRRLP